MNRKTLEQMWEEFRAECFEDERDPEAIGHIKRVFVAGMAGLLADITTAVENGTEEEFVEYMEGMVVDLDAYTKTLPDEEEEDKEW